MLVRPAKADLLLHPVRMRILQTFLGGIQGRRMTTQQIAEALDDVPQATLYRHLNKLAAGRVLVVVEERQVRGGVERVYELPPHAAQISTAELAQMTREDHLRSFTMFVSSLLGNFGRYLERERIDFVRDGVGYREVALYLNDEEFFRVTAAMNQALLPALGNQPAPGRTRRLFSSVVMPLPDSAESESGPNAGHRSLQPKADSVSEGMHSQQEG